MEKEIENKIEKKADVSPDTKIALILIRSLIKMDNIVKDTLQMLNLKIKNSCVIIPNTPSYQGMLKKVKDFVTYGEVDNEVVSLLEKRKRENEKFYRLNPPRKGYGRKGIKNTYKESGALGYRGKNINDLIKRML